VREISLDIAPGETDGLLGPNGAGKTTTISMVCGLREPDAVRCWSRGAR
jgi:ABC-2 type transport system ATP-binding protein